MSTQQNDHPMQQQNNNNNQLKVIFDSFDLDKSGTIQLKQIQNIAKKLGQEITQDQAQNIIKRLDANRDGKISFIQFKLWWQKGRKGKMQQLVFLQADGLKMVNFVTKYFKKAGISLDNKAAPKQFDTHKINIKFGQQIQQNSVSVKIQNFIKSQRYNNKVQQIVKKFPFFDKNSIHFIIKIQSQNASIAKGQFQKSLNMITSQYFQQSGQQFPLQKIFKHYCHVGKKDLYILFTFEQMLKELSMQILQPLLQMCKILGEDFYFDFMAQFEYFASIKKILESKDDLFRSLLNGFNIKVELQTNSAVMKKIRKLLQNSGQLSLLPFTLFRKTNIKINLKKPEEVLQFFKKLGIDEMLKSSPNPNQLLQTLTPMAQQVKKTEEEEAKQFIGFKFLNFLSSNASEKTEIIMINEVMATSISFRAKNASQIYKILFNEK